jgi:predicted nucleotidyltransferase
VIREIHKASTELGFQVFLVGATARIILLENVYGLNAGRATTDVDFAFALDNWEQFSAIKRYLISNANFEESADTVQRLHLRLPGFKHKFNVDLIPFGEIETTSSIIAWPPDMSIMMNVAGYADALSASISIEVSPGLTIVSAP